MTAPPTPPEVWKFLFTTTPRTGSEPQRELMGRIADSKERIARATQRIAACTRPRCKKWYKNCAKPRRNSMTSRSRSEWREMWSSAKITHKTCLCPSKPLESTAGIAAIWEKLASETFHGDEFYSSLKAVRLHRVAVVSFALMHGDPSVGHSVNRRTHGGLRRVDVRCPSWEVLAFNLPRIHSPLPKWQLEFDFGRRSCAI